MNKPEKITVQKAARLMGVSDRFVYEGMKRGLLPIGQAMQIEGSARWSFYISPTLPAAYIGANLPHLSEHLEILSNEYLNGGGVAQ